MRIETLVRSLCSAQFWLGAINQELYRIGADNTDQGTLDLLHRRNRQARKLEAAVIRKAQK